jgi:hypothetical protein
VEPITAAAIAAALIEGFKLVGQGLLSEAMPDLIVEPVRQRWQQFLQDANVDKSLLRATQLALAEAGAPADDEDDLNRWLKALNIDRLTARRNNALRRLAAQAVLSATDPAAAPPEALLVALSWPRSRGHELSQLLAALRSQLYGLKAWQAQTGLASELLADLGEETVIRILAPLAYWLHETYPGGTAPFQEWQNRLVAILAEEGFAGEAHKLAGRFLHHARYETGLLAERSLGQFGFFHLTFEEYLAAREIARQRAEKRRAILRAHWEDPRWHEVILLAAGQLGIVEARRDDASDFIEDLLKAEPSAPENAGRQMVLAGRALADIGLRSVTDPTRRWVLDALQQTMQDLDPDTKQPNDPPRTAIRLRYEAGEALDELGWLPPDLNAWVYCPGCAAAGGDLMAMKYPVTNAQFERFILAGGYEQPAYWGGENGEGWQYRERHNWSQPRRWNDVRFGGERRGYPVVGVSWYEVVAYAAWLAELLEQALRQAQDTALRQAQDTARPGKMDLPPDDQALVADLLNVDALTVRLPAEAEWVRLAGGVAAEDRSPWDPPAGPATEEAAAILARANTEEAELGGTSPVAMYPLGVSRPFGLLDLGGNVWEWTATWNDPFYILRGGSSGYSLNHARGGSRNRDNPTYGDISSGFRLVSPVGSAS